jgi:hypothetical protein
MVYIHKEILFRHKRNEILLFAITWMEPEDIMLSEISQTLKNNTYSHLHAEAIF